MVHNDDKNTKSLKTMKFVALHSKIPPVKNIISTIPHFFALWSNAPRYKV